MKFPLSKYETISSENGKPSFESNIISGVLRRPLQGYIPFQNLQAKWSSTITALTFQRFCAKNQKEKEGNKTDIKESPNPILSSL